MNGRYAQEQTLVENTAMTGLRDKEDLNKSPGTKVRPRKLDLNIKPDQGLM